VTEFEDNFRLDVKEKLADAALQEKISSARKLYRHAFEHALSGYSNIETARQRASFIRWKSIEYLDKFLIQFEATFIKSGGKVIWAQDAAEAASEVLGIILKSGSKTIVKSKSLTTDEIGLDAVLKQSQINFVETDLGMYILQMAGEKASHMVLPALHKSAEEVHVQFSSQEGRHLPAHPEELSKHAASKLREHYVRPDVGITGANFLIADQGAVAVTENEGNVMLAAARPKIHIVVVGIDKVIPSLADLNILWPLLATYGTGQMLTAYNSVLFGPKKNSEADGPSQMYVVLVDNGRTSVIAEEVQRRVMSCIRCGSCLYHDPVYSVIGGHPYRSTWMGPPGNVVGPLLNGMKSHGIFNDLSTLSAADTESCPVNIPFNKLILDNRQKYHKQDLVPATEKLFYFLWKNSMMKRDGAKWKTLRPRKYFIGNIFFKSAMGLRTMQQPASESFNEMWKKRFGSHY
jgi:L-lactate dehydrogenase complex protein LldF